jgi:DNA repair exonuclease SbcCD ATPase subunit
MELQSIQVKNFQGVSNISVAVNAPVLLVTGHNGAGKSSLRDAIRLALTGAASRVSLKKDYGNMIKDGTKKADVIIGTEEGAYNYALPAAKGVHSDNPYLPLCIDATAFASMKADDRRKALFELSGCTINANKVREMLLAEKCDPKLTEQILPMLRSGFPAAEAEAKERASQARGAWKQVTGETYGSQKAESWEAPAVEVPDIAVIDELKGQLEQNQIAINEKNQLIGTAKAAIANEANFQNRIAQLEEQAGKVERIKAKQATDEKSLTEVQQLINEAEQAALSQEALPCPCCQTLLVYSRAEHAFIDATTLSTKAGDAGIAKLEEYRNSATMLQRTIANNQRDLLNAENAAQQLQELQASAAASSESSATNIEALQGDINDLNDARQDLLGRINDLQEQQFAAAQTLTKTKDAARHHAEVLAWTTIAEQMAPSGIPANILSQALKPFQNLIDNINSLVPRWPAVGITPDMELVAGHRSYGLLSESEQWRVQAVITLALAQLSGINLVVLDRFDVLDPVSRVELMEALCDLSDQNQHLQVVMLGTLAKPAAGLPDSYIQQIWLEAGVVAEAKQEQAA